MRFFVCLFDSGGHDVPDTVRRPYESLPRSHGLAFQWQMRCQIPVLIGGDNLGGEPLVASEGDWVAVGTARLDNRLDLERWSDCAGMSLSDLELVLRMVSHHGAESVYQLLGDFGFVVCNVVTRTAVAACDAFAVKKIYYAERHGLFSFASRGEVLAFQDEYDAQYLAERVAGCVPSPGLSAYAGVKVVPAGSVALVERGRLILHRYWSPYDVAIERPAAKSGVEAAEICREFLTESVRLRLGGGMDTWAQLSGGMDSSSVASVAQWLVSRGIITHGLAGTISYVDCHGTGADEREYSDAVAKQWQLRNETVTDAPTWYDDCHAPPDIDEPSVAFVFYPRDLRACAIVAGAGGRVLLTGAGGDTLFAGNMFFFADWLVNGRIFAAAREMVRRAAIGRVSFWELAYRNAILPLLPRGLQHRLVRDQGQMPAWVRRAAVRRYGLHLRASAPLSYAGRPGHKYRDAIAAAVAEMPSSLPVGVVEDALDVRHPYLYRPLVEFALQLTPELCVQPYARKWVLREAMRGILPEPVRTRIGKGSPDGLLAWSVARQHKVLEPLIRDPILADLGVVDRASLLAGFTAAQQGPNGREKLSSMIHNTLAIEAWLQMRSGRWPRGANISKPVSADSANRPSA